MEVKDLKPFAGYVLIEPVKAETQRASGIVIPTNEDEKPLQGRVLAVGPSLLDHGQTIECPVSVGAEVFYKKFSGYDIKIDDVTYQCLKFSDLLLLIK